MCLPRKVTFGPATLFVRMRLYLEEAQVRVTSPWIRAGPDPMTGVHTRGSVDAKTHRHEREAPEDGG